MRPSVRIPCLICQQPLTLRLARGRKSGKPFLMLICQVDGRHFRGFINDQSYVKQVLAHLEGQTPASEGDADLEDNPTPGNPSKTILEGRNN